MVPFNGYFGCRCLIRGEHVEGSMRYVTDEPVEARTSDLLKRDMKMALHYKDVINGAPSIAAKIESRLLAIKPPHCVTRLPRPLKDRGHWKASE
ncbi:hypothetical protein HPB49_025976 [Dermacentor silvarum]|nr:hypothetical protein HPB49_025976 [Dermacentor silvarum]